MNQYSTASSAWAVAKWEFGRFCKLRDQLIGMISLLIGGCIGMAAMKISESSSEVQVVTNSSDLAASWSPDSRLKLTYQTSSTDELKQLVLDKKVDAALLARSDQQHDWELLVRNDPVWLDQLQQPLNQRKTQAAIVNEGIPADSLARVFAPATLEVNKLLPNTAKKIDRALAIGILTMVILTSWIGLAYMLTGISGEKQQRVTEQIVSAISAQAWIDGKLLGITAAAFASTANFVITGLVALLVARWFGFDMPLPNSLARLDLFVWITLYCVGSVFLWNCFYAAVAAIINDPNTSARSSLMFLPVLPMATAAFAMAKPDGMWMRLLSWLPGSSGTAMPIRLLLGQVGLWEVAGSLLALALAIVVLRIMAGRVFRAGILLTGKEPSWIEIARWTLVPR